MDAKKTVYLKIAVVLMGFALFLYSLLQIAFIVDDNDTPKPIASLEAILFGWTDLFGAGISWVANFFLVFSWIILFKNLKLALTSSWFSAILALSFLFFDEVISNENLARSKVIACGIGYWLWLGSCSATSIGCLFIHIATKKHYHYAKHR